MILSVSRRTDIPAFYSDWFINRLREEVVLVRNPMNYHSVSKINLSPNVVDCIVFWSKNPKPMFKYLDEIEDKYKFYFQYTINAYENDMEPYLPSLDERLESFIYLSNKFGKEKVIWRYDPIVITPKYNLEWHINKFDYIASKLKNYTNDCVFSFLDIYDKNRKDRRKRDHENFEINMVSDTLALFALPDDGPDTCDHFYCSKEGNKECTEVYILPQKDFIEFYKTRVYKVD